EVAHEPGWLAIALLMASGFRYGEGSAWDTVGRAHFMRGEFAAAADCHERASALQTDPTDRLSAGRILRHLGEARRALGDLPGAREAWERSLAIDREADRSEAAELRELLAETAGS
ncbi:MAG TPA: tetratricopeptide repeat protein, partial [Phytomonospora sp.]